MTQEILAEKKGGVGHIVLNRPQALNALNYEMITAMHAALDDFESDDAVKMVLVTSASDKAFCAGGDVKSIAIAAKEHRDVGGDPSAFQEFFRAEYELNTKIHTYEKPYVSVISGICMGGGMGISMHGSHRILTENASFAMPEVKIGFFPDVGGGALLSRMDGGFGLYLGLTGAHINAADMMYLKLGTHYMDVKGVDHLIEKLVTLDWSRSETLSVLNSTLANYSEDTVPMSDLAPLKDDIKQSFDPDSLDKILERLNSHEQDWAVKASKALQKACPLSVQIAYAHYLASKGREFEEIIIDEYRLSQFFMHEGEFYEGVRALLIDKDNAPQWTTSYGEDPQEIYTHALESFDGDDLDV